MANERWTREQIQNLVINILTLQKKGLSVRRACEKIARQDVLYAIKLENKLKYFRRKNKDIFLQIKKDVFEGRTFNAKNVISFRKVQSKNKENYKANLSDSEIKSLFMGLVKLVKKSAISEYSNIVEKNTQNTDKNFKLALVSIEKEKRKSACLKEENKRLNLKVNQLKLKVQQMRCDLKINKNKR